LVGSGGEIRCCWKMSKGTEREEAMRLEANCGVSLRRSCHRIEHVKDRIGSELYGVAGEVDPQQ
jgi:hypothetical protein